jgi:hypothetical protein
VARPAGDRSSGLTHRFDYYYEPGMQLRPAPPRIQPSPDWLPVRKRQLGHWRDLQEVPAPTPYIDMLADHFWQGDRHMDAVVALAHRIGARTVRTMLDTALDQGIETLHDAPAELIELFGQLDRKPSWFDEEIIERGRVVLGNASYYGKIAASLAEAVVTAHGAAVSSATGATGKLVRDAVRRQFESAEYFWKVTLPGGLDRQSEPFKTNVRVRLMHAQVRHGLRRRWGDEHFAHHGNPISNTDMASGAAAFGLAALLFDVGKGARYSLDDLDAAVMYWSYIGYVFGVSEEILPTGAEQAIELLDYVISVQGASTQWSSEISAALLDFLGLALVSHPLLRRNPVAQRLGILTVCGLIDHVVGDPLAARFLEQAPVDRRAVKITSHLIDIGASFGVPLSRFVDLRPGKVERRVRRVVRGDRYLGAAYASNRALARRRAVRAGRFDVHDHSRPEDFDRVATDDRRPVLGRP